MLTGFQEAIGPAKVSPYAISEFLCAEILQPVIAHEREWFVSYGDVIAIAVLVFGWIVAKDATLYLIALGTNSNCFGYLQHTIRSHQDVAMKTENSFVSGREVRRQKQAGEPESFHSIFPILTSGTCATSSEAFWKNPRCVNPDQPAIMLLGTVSTRVLNWRTEPL